MSGLSDHLSLDSPRLTSISYLSEHKAGVFLLVNLDRSVAKVMVRVFFIRGVLLIN